MRFLVTRLRFLGDIVLSTPVLETLRERFPDATIEYLASSPHAEVLSGHPSVDRLHVLPPNAGPGDVLGILRALRAGPRIDWAFDLFSNPRSAILVALSGAHERVGSARGLRSRIYQHRRARPAGDRSAIRHHLDKLMPLLGELPAPRPTRLQVDPAGAHRVTESLGLGARDFTVMHPGSTWPDKAWPEGRWPELIRNLDRQRCGEIVVLSPPGEAAMAGRVADAGGARLLPPLPIVDLSCLLSRARLYVGNDGGVMHMAVAHGIPTVALFGPTEPDIWFPYEGFGPFRVLHACGPEEFDASGVPTSRLGQIDVEQVAAAIEDVLARAGEVWR